MSGLTVRQPGRGRPNILPCWGAECWGLWPMRHPNRQRTSPEGRCGVSRQKDGGWHRTAQGPAEAEVMGTIPTSCVALPQM